MRNDQLAGFLVGFGLLFCGFVGTQAGLSPSAAFAADGEWVRDCKGYADVKGNVTFEQGKTMALAMARSQALTRIFGSEFSHRRFMRIFDGGPLIEDEMSQSVAGLILESSEARWREESISTGTLEPRFQRLHVTVDLRVAKLPKPESSFTVTLGLSKKTLVSGDPLTLEVKATDKVHLTVFSLGGDNRIYLVYPNQFRQDVVVERGKAIRLPAPDDPFELRPRTVEGHREDIEVVRVVATQKAVIPPETKDGVVSAGDFFRWLGALPRSGWSEAEDNYTVHASGQKK